MRITFALVGSAIVWLADTHGNPIAIDSQRRPAMMVSEAVTVAVGPGHSTVTGEFSFRQEPDDWPEEKDTHVLVYVPVILSRQCERNYEETHGAPVVSVQGRRLIASMRNDLALADQPKQVKLPKGWFVQIYETRIPLGLVATDFEIGIRYVQPNFPNETVGYVPLLPPKDTDTARILFEAPEGQLLRPVGFLSFLAPKRQRIQFIPQDRKLIAVRLHKR